MSESEIVAPPQHYGIHTGEWMRTGLVHRHASYGQSAFHARHCMINIKFLATWTIEVLRCPTVSKALRVVELSFVQIEVF